MAMQSWFPDAKLGIFVHYGIYAVDGIAESWSFFDGTVSHEDYMKQLDGFTASAFDAAAWARLFRDAGARYAVLTTKHHDGVALWDTGANELSTFRATPSARDVVAEFAEATRTEGLRVGLYFSHLDWTHPDYASLRPPEMAAGERGNVFAVPASGDEDPVAWQRFLDFHRQQLTELIDRFDPDLLWFDGDWERSPEQWRMAEVGRFIAERSPRTVVNGRMAGGFGDYATPEQAVPVIPPEGPWELCLTVNNSWGWQRGDDDHKSLRQIVRIFVETIGGGGNLLLDVGPTEDGLIAPPQEERLRGLGAWIRRHEAAVFGTGRGLPAGHFYGPSTVSEDRRRLYLFVFDVPRDELVIRGLSVGVSSARVLGTGLELGHRRVCGLNEAAGWEYLAFDGSEHAADLDPLCTVIEVELDGPLVLSGEHTRD